MSDNVSHLEFWGAKYYDKECDLYTDFLPDGYYEKEGKVYLKENGEQSLEIVVITQNKEDFDFTDQ